MARPELHAVRQLGRARVALVALALLLPAACGKADPADAPLLGTLEWDRIGVPAEASEPIVRIAVREGERVKAGQLLLVLDDRRMQARTAQADADIAQARARVEELENGSRIEQVDAARATLASAQASQVEAQKQYARFEALGRAQVVARAAVDATRATRDRAVAQVAQAQAQLRELTVGTRPEQVTQAEAALANAEAARKALDVDRARLSVHAPRAGRVDALPFKLGDQPPAGATLASLLVGDAPYARVFVPESRRVALREGQRFTVQVQGTGALRQATLRSIAHDPAFTPYYALTGDDASRLVYRAELVLTDADAANLPGGVPVQARLAR
jgi:HlyD family secretion protein